MNYYLNQQHKLKNQFILPNYVMQLDLSATALAIYCYLMYIENRKTYQCYPSYKTIGKVIKIKSVYSEQTPQETKFEPKKGKIRKQGTGCISKINDHLYEGRYSPKDAYGRRMARNVYTKTEEECEIELAKLIVRMKAEIAAQKAELRMAQ